MRWCRTQHLYKYWVVNFQWHTTLKMMAVQHYKLLQ